MKLSIIIPAYNVEKYIVSCLTSVIKQDLPFSDYEIIVINDGSTDSTYTKIIDFAKNYPNFVIINKANEGLGMTRNYGIDKAHGKYILFLDSDDSIAENSLGSLCTQMDSDNLDILEFDFTCVDEKREKIVPEIFPNRASCHLTDVIMSGRESLLHFEYFIPMVWTRLYRTELLRKNNLYMIHEKHEDENFTPRAYYYAERVKYTDTVIYYYLQRSDSIMGSYNTTNLFDIVTSIGLLKNFAMKSIPESDVKLHNYFQVHCTNIVSTIYIRSINKGFNVEKKLIHIMKKYNMYPFDNKRYKKYKIVYDFSTLLFIPYFRRKLKKLGIIQN